MRKPVTTRCELFLRREKSSRVIRASSFGVSSVFNAAKSTWAPGSHSPKLSLETISLRRHRARRGRRSSTPRDHCFPVKRPWVRNFLRLAASIPDRNTRDGFRTNPGHKWVPKNTRRPTHSNSRCFDTMGVARNAATNRLRPPRASHRRGTRSIAKARCTPRSARRSSMRVGCSSSLRRPCRTMT